MMRLTLSALALSAALAFPALAQDTEATTSPAMLVADRVFVEGNDRLIATGHVEALQGSTRLVAERIVYDQSTGTLSIEGPIRVTENGTEVIITADQAELDQGLQNGLMMGARMVLDQQLQLASVQAHRVNGRYTQLSKVAVASCQVCGANQTPLW
jgi:LPS-assembly protein